MSTNAFLSPAAAAALATASTPDTVTDNGDGTFTYTDSAGGSSQTWATGDTIVDNNNGTFTVTPSDGSPAFDVPYDIDAANDRSANNWTSSDTFLIGGQGTGLDEEVKTDAYLNNTLHNPASSASSLAAIHRGATPPLYQIDGLEWDKPVTGNKTERYKLKAGGNPNNLNDWTLLFTANEDGDFEVPSLIQSGGSNSAGRTRRVLNYYNASGLTSQRVHLEFFGANADTSKVMLDAHVFGYAYNESKVVDLRIVGYAYSTTQSVIRKQIIDLTNGNHPSNGIYKSSNGNLTAWFDVTSTYYLGFSVDVRDLAEPLTLKNDTIVVHLTSIGTTV